MLAVGIGSATTAADPLAAEVAGLGVGGVLLLGTNVEGAAQVQALLAGLDERSPRRLLAIVDEEGGRVSRLRPLVGRTPSARELGRRPPREITAAARERGETLAGLGFDLVLAPVVDADGGPAQGAIGDRAFSADPAEAGQAAQAFAAGLAAAGVAATAKHFPGTGQTEADSHDGRVVSGASREEVERLAAAGFGPLVDAGVAAVMMSHVEVPALGPLPASVEPGAYRLLRSLGFEGAALTDAVNMAAVGQRWSLPEAAVLALAAGADLVLATPGEQTRAMRDAVVGAVAAGRLGEDRLDEAVERVLTLQGADPATMVCR